MMPARQPAVPYAEYVARERTSAQKHEYLGGEILAMAGGTPRHASLAAAFASELRAALRGRPCTVYSSDLRVRVQATGMATYPDVTVVCGHLETDAEDPDAVVNPALVVEVLSDSTEAHDRGEKAAHYRHVPSLREYVFVTQQHPRVEVYRRNEAGRWELFEFGPGSTCELSSVDGRISVDEVYRDPLAGVA